MTDRGIVLYDYLQVLGGAERITLGLARELAAGNLCLGYLDPALFGAGGLGGLQLTDLGVRSRRPELQAIRSLRSFAADTGFLDAYDWVLFSGVYAPAAVVNAPRARRLYYCHSLPRFAYDLKEYYLAAIPAWQRPLLHGLVRYVAPRYAASVRRMDRVIANSENVRGRLLRYLGLEAVVVHPFCEVERFRWLGQGDYYLSSARLEPYKRVEPVVRAFLRLPDRKLLVASGGSDLPRLKKLADGARNIQFTGWLSEQRLLQLTGNAIATLYFPIDEDFGMSPVESMAAGKPVIGVAEGGLLETVVPERTGLLLTPEFGVDDIVAAVRRLSPRRAVEMRPECERRAQRFRKERFFARMRELIHGSR